KIDLHLRQTFQSLDVSRIELRARHGEWTQACRCLRIGRSEHAGCRRGSLLSWLTAIENQDPSSALAKLQSDGHADNPRAGNDHVRCVHTFIVKALVDSSPDDLDAASSETLTPRVLRTPPAVAGLVRCSRSGSR